MIGGSVVPGLEPVADVFAGTLEGSLGGAAFAVVVDGEIVVDLWGGAADPQTGAPWIEETMALLFSGTKGVLATCVMLLLERGAIDIDVQVARYWPEFGAAGKEDVTVRQLLCHLAGVPGLRRHVGVKELMQPQAMAAAVAMDPPFWPPGERLAYHALTFHWLWAELIRRIDGRPLDAFIAEEIASPLRLDLWSCVPVELESRIATLVRSKLHRERYEQSSDDPDFVAVYGEVMTDFRWNEPSLRDSNTACLNGVGTARSLARLYGCLARGGELDGTRLVDASTVATAVGELSRGACAITDRPYAFGAGFELQTELARFGPVGDAFGHTGLGGSTHGAWPSRRVGFSYVMSELRDGDEDTRGPDLLTALAAVI